jgi:hypothetical protein
MPRYNPAEGNGVYLRLWEEWSLSQFGTLLPITDISLDADAGYSYLIHTGPVTTLSGVTYRSARLPIEYKEIPHALKC